MNYKNIVVESAIEPGIARVLLNRPDAGNRMSLETLAELKAAFAAIDTNPDIRVVILIGTGKTWVGGGDTEFFLNAESVFDNRDYLQRLYEVFKQVEALQQPVIAAVNGWAIGAGAEFVAACDFAYAGESAKFSMPECVMGMVSNIQAALFPYYASIGRVREWLYTGDAIDAREAERWGLVNRVVPDSELLEETLKTARKIAKYPKLGIRFQKELVNMYWLRTDLETSMRAGPNFSALAHTTGEPKRLVKASIAARHASKAKRESGK